MYVYYEIGGFVFVLHRGEHILVDPSECWQKLLDSFVH